MKRAGIYMRVSSDKQRKQDTIASQKRILPPLAQERGYQTVDQYIDDGASGESIEGRPEFQRLLGDVKSGKLDAVFAVDFDRITRSSNEMEQAFIRQTFKEHGVVVETINGTLDLKNYENALVSGIMGLVASMEKSKILARTRRGKETKWKNGKHASGHVPFGYRANGNKEYEIELPEAEIVQKVFELSAKGYGACWVAQRLNALGLPVPSESRGIAKHVRRYEGWAKSSVRKILDRTCYLGYSYVNVTQRIKGKRTARPRSDWIKISFPPLIPEGLFNEVQRLKKVHKTNSGTFNPKYIISRLVRCECGSKLTVEPQRDGRFFYSCYRQRRLKACDMPWQDGRLLENAIWGHVEKLISNPEYLEEAITESYREWEESHRGTISKDILEKKLEDKVNERNRVIRLHVRGKISEREMDQQLDSIRKEEEILLENISMVQKAEEARANIESSLTKIKREVRRVRKRIQTLTSEDKRRILQTLLGGDLITVFKNGEVEIPRISDFKFIETTAEKIHLISAS